MARVQIHDSKDLTWKKIRESFPPDTLSTVEESVLESRVSIHELGSADEPQLTEAEYLPHALIGVHSHGEDEIIYVVAGSMVLGNRELKLGSSLFIAAGTLYGFSAGNDGVRLAIFRVRGDGHSAS